MKDTLRSLRTIVATLIGFGSCTMCANAATISLSQNGLNRLVVSFSLPIQPANHIALNIGVTPSSLSSFSATATLLDGIIPLSQSLTTYVGERYATSGSFFSGVDPIIDYTSITNGTINGLFILDVTGGTASFDSSNFFITPFGDGGTSPGFGGVVTNVQATAVPEPSISILAGLGAVYLAAIRRKRPN